MRRPLRYQIELWCFKIPPSSLSTNQAPFRPSSCLVSRMIGQRVPLCAGSGKRRRPEGSGGARCGPAAPLKEGSTSTKAGARELGLWGIAGGICGREWWGSHHSGHLIGSLLGSKGYEFVIRSSVTKGTRVLVTASFLLCQSVVDLVLTLWSRPCGALLVLTWWKRLVAVYHKRYAVRRICFVLLISLEEAWTDECVVLDIWHVFFHFACTS